MNYSVVLKGSKARDAILALCRQLQPHIEAGAQFFLTATDAKTRAQENLYHSCFSDLAEHCLFNGRKTDAAEWKSAIKQAFYEETKSDPDFLEDWIGREPRVVQTLDGRNLLYIEIETKRFTKNLARAFITFVHATGDARGVRWSPKSLGREWSELAS